MPQRRIICFKEFTGDGVAELALRPIFSRNKFRYPNYCGQKATLGTKDTGIKSKNIIEEDFWLSLPLWHKGG